MSVISNIHTATIYDAKKSAPFEGQRLVKVIAKADKDGNYGPHLQQTMCTSIPQLQPDSIVDALNDDKLQVRLMPHFVAYLETVQNALIADKIKSGTNSVSSLELEIVALCDYLENDTVGDKWDSARVAGWFTDHLAIPYTEKLMENGVSDSDIEGKLKMASSRFSETMASKAKIPALVANSLNKLLALADCGMDNPVYKKFYTKLNPPIVADALDLGF